MNNKRPNIKRNPAPKKNKFVAKPHDKRVDINIKEQISQSKTGLKDNIFVFSSVLSVSDFASKINKNPSEVIKNLFMKGAVVTLNTILTEEQIGELCLEFGYDFEKRDEVTEENILNNLSVKDKPEHLIARPPVVTIMGHVDHGKTSLLDKIRTTNVIASESGGITQHIGAYQVVYENKKISFIDTPGHEAFTKMRARGASITDIVVLVIAADDGIKPQTIEALNHARAANVKIIIFINKMDKPNAKPDVIKSQLADQNLLVEEFGGDNLCILGSVKTQQGISELLEAILFVAEIMNLKANPNRLAYGTTIEAHLDKGYGPIATLLIENGTLVKGDHLIIGSTTGKVRIMRNDKLEVITEAPPSTPVKVAGLLDIPQAGDKFLALKSEKEAKLIYSKISEKKWKERIYNLLSNQSSTDGENKLVNIIIKTDVHGSLEAIKAMLDKIEIPNITLRIINSSTGSINESDLQLAKVSNGVIFGFNVKPAKFVRELANSASVMIRFHNIIYQLIEEVKQLMLGALDPIEVETILGEAEILQLWRHSKIGTIAGCKVTSGKLVRNCQARLIREGIVIYTSKISSLRHGKEDVREAVINKECGLTLDGFQDLKEGDIIEAFQIKIETQHEGLTGNDASSAKNKKVKKVKGK